MQAVEILNNYRHSLGDDRIGTLVLSILLRFGALSEDELQEHTALGTVELRKKIDQLFRASLIKLSTGSRFRLTELGKTVLSSFGITAAVVQALIDAFPLTVDERFLLLNFAPTFKEPTSHTSPLLSLLQSAAAIIEADTDYFSRIGSLARFLRATVIGLSPVTPLLDSVALYQTMSRAWLAQTDELHNEDKPQSISANQAMPLCDQAKFDVQLSNHYFAIGEREFGKISILVKYLSQMRVLCAISSGYFDNQLRVIYHSGHSEESVAKMLTDTKFLFSCRQVMTREGLLSGTEEPSRVADYVRGRLARNFVFDNPMPIYLVNRSTALGSFATHTTQDSQLLIERIHTLVNEFASAQSSPAAKQGLTVTLSRPLQAQNYYIYAPRALRQDSRLLRRRKPKRGTLRQRQKLNQY